MSGPAMPQGGVWLAPDALFDGQDLRADLALHIGADGRTGALAPRAALPQAAALIPVAGTICAGFLDLQVNGGGDALLNNDPSSAAIARIAAAHRRFGTVGILPTVITDAPAVLDRAVSAALAAQHMQGVLGLHIEGPHIALARRGTHRAAFIRPFDAGTLDHILRLRAAGVFVKITLAPEAASPAQVAQIVATGAVVSIGHSDATSAQVRALLDAGASCFTHLFNAMSPMQARAAGVTGACITSDAYAGIICDGHHVADEMIALAIRARARAGRMFLVSDAMATVGGSDSFTLYGQRIQLQDGRLVNAEGALAGAHTTMAEGVARLITAAHIAPHIALDMAISVPARLIAAPQLASPAHRNLADILVLDQAWRAQFLSQHPALAALC